MEDLQSNTSNVNGLEEKNSVPTYTFTVTEVSGMLRPSVLNTPSPVIVSPAGRAAVVVC